MKKILFVIVLILLIIFTGCEKKIDETISDDYQITYDFTLWLKDNGGTGVNAPYDTIITYSGWQSDCDGVILTNESFKLLYIQPKVNQGYAQGIWFSWAMNDTVASMIQTNVGYSGIECVQIFYKIENGIVFGVEEDGGMINEYENYKYNNNVVLFPDIQGNKINYSIYYRKEIFEELTFSEE